jgi:hypothetical protein
MEQLHEMSAGIDQQQVSEWLAEIVAWENDPSQPNPFRSRSTSLSIFGFTLHFNLIRSG